MLHYSWLSECGTCCRCDGLNVGVEVEVLVLSDTSYFEDFQVVRDVYVPSTGQWLCDYPFVKREPFQEVSAEIFRARRNDAEQQAPYYQYDQQQQQPPWP